MESSAISLYFRVLRRRKNEAGEDISPEVNEHMINLIDSPGHIDFSSEVSAASRLCDGAVVLVDVVEGVCSQTVNVLRQSWVDKLRPVLVLNKIDRLITELKMTPAEAHVHLSQVIEQVNSVIGSFFAGERMQEDLLWRERLEKLKLEGAEDKHEEYVERDDEELYFAPEKNNVIFASAIDGWGFTISQFAAFYERKLGMKRENLQKVLWGDFFIDPKTKKVINSKGLKGRNLKPLFVSLVLDNIWTIYENCLETKDHEMLEKIAKSLQLKVSARDMRSKDVKNLLHSMMSQWIPVSSAVLLTVVEKIPSPLISQHERLPTIFSTAPGVEHMDKRLEEAMMRCDPLGPACAYVSKVISVPESELPRNRRVGMSEDELVERGRKARELAAKLAEEARSQEEQQAPVEEEEEEEVGGVTVADPFGFDDFEQDPDEIEDDAVELEKEALIGFARIYSGTLKVGESITVLGPKFDPTNPTEHVSTATITDLYLLMGRELVALDEVPAGNIVGIGGLAGKVLKNGTLVSGGVLGVNLAGITLHAPPIVKVALEPVNPTHMDRLSKGLELLNQADPCVQTYLQDTGEHILATAGELHLERCLKDLKERFAGIDIQASEPVIPYRETIVASPDMHEPENSDLGRGVVELSLGKFKLTYSIKPLPEAVTSFLSNNRTSIHAIMNRLNQREGLDEDVALTQGMDVAEFRNRLNSTFGESWQGVTDKIVSFGPKRVGPNVMFDLSGNLKLVFSEEANSFEYQDSLLNGFQLAMLEGPLAAEPLQGVAVMINAVETLEEESEVTNIAGPLITSTRDKIHEAFLDWSPRLMLAMYTCDIQTSAEVLGKVYAVVQKRRGRILAEEMKEGTPFFTITSTLPVVEAFGFSEDIRKRTSGAASPQLVFAGFEAIDQDPFWVPTTEEELEELGEFADRENIARKYMNGIRRRKGLFVDDKVIQNAEKQRNLKRD